ncbi:TPA: hypothetical protein N0F65_012021, partial [Lagenidium giganteum]
MKTETQAVAELDTGAVAAGAKYYELQTPKQAKDSQFKYNDVDTDGGDDTSIKLVSIFELFSFADRTDKILMTVGTISALIAGISQPLQIVLIGDVMNAFNPMDLPDAAQLRSNVNTVALNFVLVSIGVFAFCFLQVACWSLTASRQAKHIRSAYVNAILNKEIGWFDVNEPMQLSTRVADSTVTIQEGMGRKVGDGLHFFSMAVSGVMIGLIKGWELALILLAFMPLLAFSAFASMRRLADATQTGIESYGKAGAVAQEALGNVRTVHMFNAIQHFVTKYGLALEESVNAGIRKGFAVGWGIGVMFFVLYCTYAAGLYFGAVQIGNDQLDGSKCTGSGCYDGGKVMTVFFSVSMGAMALGQAGPSIQAVFAARTAAYSVFAYDKTKDEMLDNARAWSIGLVALGVVFALSIIAQHYGFAVASQKLVGRVRLQTFQAMLQQEIGWFDLDENASGALVSKLATDSATLQAMTSDTLNQGLVNVTTLAIGLGIAFYYSWQMTLANLATLPILGFSAFIQSKQLAGTINNRENNEADLAAGAVLAEAISSIRTVASFSMEKAINVAYVTFIDASKKTDIK